MEKSHKIFLIIASALCLVIILTNIILTSSKKDLTRNDGNDVIQNIKELTDLEDSNITDINNDIEQVQEELNPPKPEEPTNPTEPKNYKEIFSSSLIMGDSQTEGLTVYGFLDNTSVIGVKGGNLVSAKANNITTLSSLSPKHIFTLYGMNDILIYQSNIDGFIDDYTSLIKEIQALLPDSKVFVNSILPVEEKVTIGRPVYKQIDTYNTALRAMCDELDVEYVNSNQILIDNTTLFEGDGMHLKPSFYNKWLDLLNNYI
ncbi:GDSL-type esterase/lipase family protein [uncultured Clostridium sp.]|jgi:hypothetical protein|uniref:GDSL-type esterase/lipase family protein n=1 Tax=uncultured Clostridium sp. TaxID=59620 RepID=UPI002614FE2D|nr:GDSL-type esterase/lipase family protein [uncultured Clostridium sp.]